MGVPHYPEEQYTVDGKRCEYMTEMFLVDDGLTDISTTVEPTPLDARIEALAAVMPARRLLRELSPALSELFDLAIHTIYYNRSIHSGGGSISSLPGVIWLANRKPWSVIDLTEVLVHEFTHNLIFLDERTHGHYAQHTALANADNFALSAILKRVRPLDKAFHSLLVAHELLVFRTRIQENATPMAHPPTPVLFQQTMATAVSVQQLIKRKPELVQPRLKSLLDKVFESLYQMKANTSLGLAAA
ncbi:hypothetical protein WK31_26055 [Burkholderia vietnamiensis]|nr:hypothetical protein WK31_26055 [Burkholderia vietnamiensis]